MVSGDTGGDYDFDFHACTRNRECAEIEFLRNNCDAYRHLACIEIILRELLRHCMSENFGPQWRKRLPGAVLTKIRESQKEDRRPQYGHVCLGPLYYLSFGELLEVLKQKYAKRALEMLGGEGMLSELENLIPIRNAVCHSRPCSKSSAQSVLLTHEHIANALTGGLINSYLTSRDVGIYQEDAIPMLISWLSDIKKRIERLERTICTPPECELCKEQYWWGDAQLAGFDCKLIDTVAKLITAYNGLPKGIGSAGGRQMFCDEQHVITAINMAELELRRISS